MLLQIDLAQLLDDKIIFQIQKLFFIFCQELLASLQPYEKLKGVCSNTKCKINYLSN